MRGETISPELVPTKDSRAKASDLLWLVARHLTLTRSTTVDIRSHLCQFFNTASNFVQSSSRDEVRKTLNAPQVRDEEAEVGQRAAAAARRSHSQEQRAGPAEAAAAVGLRRIVVSETAAPTQK